MSYNVRNNTDELMDAWEGILPEYLEEADNLMLQKKNDLGRKRIMVLLAAAVVFIAAVGTGMVLIIRNYTGKSNVSTNLTLKPESTGKTTAEENSPTVHEESKTAEQEKPKTTGMNAVLSNLSDTALEELGESVTYIGKTIRKNDVTVFIEASLADGHLYYVTFYVEGAGGTEKPEVSGSQTELIFPNSSDLKTYVSYCSPVDIQEESARAYFCLTYIWQTRESEAAFKIDSLFGSSNGKMFSLQNEEPVPVSFRPMKTLTKEGDDVFKKISLSPLSLWVEDYGIADPDHLKEKRPKHDIYICMKDNTRIGADREAFAEDNGDLPFFADELSEKDHGMILITFRKPVDLENIDSISVDGREYKFEHNKQY